MKRRSFLSSAAIASFSLPFITHEKLTGEIKRGYKPEIDSFELLEADISLLQEYMQTGKHSSRQITELYIDRIRNFDKKGPSVNSVIELNPEALSIADLMDKERKSGKIRGPLHGIPVLIKDNIDTADKK